MSEAARRVDRALGKMLLLLLGAVVAATALVALLT